MNRFRKLFLLIGLLCFGVIISGCNGREETPDELVVWMGKYWAGEGEQYIREMMDRYEEVSGITVRVELQQDIHTKLKSAMRSGEQVDIVIWDRWETPEYAQNGFFVDLDNYLQRDGIKKEDFLSEAFNEMVVNGKTYGLPLDLDPHGIWVNTDAVEKLPETWDELKEQAIKATVKNGDRYQRVGLHLDVAGYFNSFIQTAGGSMLKDEKTAGFNDAHGYAVLNFWRDLFDSGIYAPGAVSGDNFTASDPFLTGKVAMRIDSLLNAGPYYSKYTKEDFNYEFIPFPKGPDTYGANEIIGNVEPGTYSGGLLGGYGLAIFSQSKFKDEAWNVIKWWVGNDETMMLWHEISGFIPSRTTIIKNEEYRAILEQNKNIKNILPVIESYKARPRANGYTNVENAILTPKIKALLEQGLYDNEADPIQACLDDMEKAANARFNFSGF